MGRIRTDIGYDHLGSRPPTNEEIHAAMEEALAEAGIPAGAVEIQEGEWSLWSPRKIGADKLLPCHAAIVRQSGLVLLFAVAGPAGIHKRVDDFRNPNISNEEH